MSSSCIVYISALSWTRTCNRSIWGNHLAECGHSGYKYLIYTPRNTCPASNTYTTCHQQYKAGRQALQNSRGVIEVAADRPGFRRQLSLIVRLFGRANVGIPLPKITLRQRGWKFMLLYMHNASQNDLCWDWLGIGTVALNVDLVAGTCIIHCSSTTSLLLLDVMSNFMDQYLIDIIIH